MSKKPPGAFSGERKEQRRSFKDFFRTSPSPTLHKDGMTGKAPETPTDQSQRPAAGTTGSISPPSGELSPSSIYMPPRVQHRRASDNVFGGAEAGGWSQKIAISEDFSPAGRPKSQTIDMGVRPQVSNTVASLGFLLNGYDELDIPTLERTFSVRSSEDIERPRGDPLYNLMDAYAVMLCVSLLRADTFPSLCTIATLGSVALSDKARQILVHLLGIIGRLFPDRNCAQLLSDPSLIEYSSTFASLKQSGRALKASQLLLSLSTAFSLSRGRGGYTANSIMSSLASDRKSGSRSAQQVRGVLDSIASADCGLDLGKHPEEIGADQKVLSNVKSSNDFLASRIREHRVTRVISDILDEIAHTGNFYSLLINPDCYITLLSAYARVSRIIGTAAALKDNNPDAFKSRNVRESILLLVLSSFYCMHTLCR